MFFFSATNLGVRARPIVTKLSYILGVGCPPLKCNWAWCVHGLL